MNWEKKNYGDDYVYFISFLGHNVMPKESKTVCKCLEFLSSMENFTGELSFLFCDNKVFDNVLQKRLEVSHAYFSVKSKL